MRWAGFIIFILSGISSLSQNRIISNQGHLWLVYNGVFKLNQKFNLLTEYQWRRDDMGKNWQQSLPRIGVEYKTKAGINFAAGYAFPTTYPYGDQPIAYVTNEQRAWEQFSVGHTNGKLKFSHRYRFEQRWVEVKTKNSNGEYEFEKYKYLNRGRYRLVANYNVKHFEKTNNDFFFSAMEEILVSFGKNVGKNVFDQNRISGSFGFTFNGKYTISLGYLNQYILKADGIHCENNHTLQFSLSLNL